MPCSICAYASKVPCKTASDNFHEAAKAKGTCSIDSGDGNAQNSKFKPPHKKRSNLLNQPMIDNI